MEDCWSFLDLKIEFPLEMMVDEEALVAAKRSTMEDQRSCLNVKVVVV